MINEHRLMTELSNGCEGVNFNSHVGIIEVRGKIGLSHIKHMSNSNCKIKKLELPLEKN